MGHASRCLTIARKLQEEGVEVAFASYGCGYEMIDSYHKYQTLKLPEIKFYGDKGILDIKYTVKKSIEEIERLFEDAWGLSKDLDMELT